MNEFLIVLLVALGVFGLLAAGLALRQRRHPAAGGACAGSGCPHCGSRIKCLDPPSPNGPSAPSA
jgi:hypothetical protein